MSPNVKKTHDPAYHLVFGDVVLDNRTAPTHQVRVKASKTDPFKQGVTVHIGRTDKCLCPVMVVLAYMVARGGWPRPSVQMGGWSVPDERGIRDGGQDSSGGSGPGGTRL